MRRPGVIERFRARLPLPPNAPEVSLGEGSTPLVALNDLPKLFGVRLRLFAKVEGANPTGSFKDRGMAVAVSAAVADGATGVICASTGNTSAAAAAYAARVRLPCVVLIPAGQVASGKIAQATVHGARIIQIDGGFDEAMAAVSENAESGLATVNSTNPMRLQGQKTAAWEIVEELGGAPDFHALPVGNAGNITAYWMGYSEAAGKNTEACRTCKGDCPYLADGDGKRPVMLGYQAAGAAPFVRDAPVQNPQTVATAIRIGHPQSFAAAKTVFAESGGRAAAIDDAELLQMQKTLAEREGVFCEPASAAGVAGAIMDARAGRIPEDALVVCTLTGHGLKDPEIIGKPKMDTVAAPDIAAALRAAVAGR